MGIIICKSKKYIFIVELFYFVYIIIKNVHLNRYKFTIYKFIYLWIFFSSYLTSTYLTLCTLYSPFLWNFLRIIRDKTRWDFYDSFGHYLVFIFSLVFANDLIHNITNRKPVSTCIQASAFRLLRGSPHHAAFSLTQWEGGVVGAASQESKFRSMHV